MISVVLPRRRALAALGGALATPMIASGIARAQADWPTKSVRYINLFPAGATTDVLSRIVCQELSELTGQQFIVENRGGSGGNVGADAIAKSAPDGYTVGLYSIASHAISPTLYARLPFNPRADFTFVSTIWQLPNMLVVNLDVPAKTVPELIELLRQSPGKYSYGSAGSGTTRVSRWALTLSAASRVATSSSVARSALASGQVTRRLAMRTGPVWTIRTGAQIPPGFQLSSMQSQCW